MADLFDLQDELTAAIVSGVEPEPGAHERNLARRKRTDSLTAWEMCQKGCSEFARYTDEGYSEAVAAYETACRFPNADYFVFMATALKHAKLGDRDKAAHHLAQARERHPALSTEFWRGAFRFPVWTRRVAVNETNLQILFDLGLPPE